MPTIDSMIKYLRVTYPDNPNPKLCFQKVKKPRTLKNGTKKDYYYWELRRGWRDPKNWRKLHSTTELHIGKATPTQKQPSKEQKEKTIQLLKTIYPQLKMSVHDLR